MTKYRLRSDSKGSEIDDNETTFHEEGFLGEGVFSIVRAFVSEDGRKRKAVASPTSVLDAAEHAEVERKLEYWQSRYGKKNVKLFKFINEESSEETYRLMLPHLDGVPYTDVPINTPMDEIARFDALAQVLEEDHALGWLNGDLKSSNILLCTDGITRPVDGGLAARFDRDHLSSDSFQYETKAQVEEARKKTYHIAPECFSTELVIPKPSMDIYSLGSDMAYRLNLLNKDRPRELNHRQSLTKFIIRACLSKDPMQRPSLKTIRTQLKLLSLLVQRGEINTIRNMRKGDEVFWPTVLGLLSQQDKNSIACQRTLFEADFTPPNPTLSSLKALHQSLYAINTAIPASFNHKVAALAFIAKINNVSIDEPLHTFSIQLLGKLTHTHPSVQKNALEALSTIIPYVKNEDTQAILTSWFFTRVERPNAHQGRITPCGWIFGQNINAIRAEDSSALQFLSIIFKHLNHTEQARIQTWCTENPTHAATTSVTAITKGHTPAGIHSLYHFFDDPNIGLNEEQRASLCSPEHIDTQTTLATYALIALENSRNNQESYQDHLSTLCFLMLENPCLYQKVENYCKNNTSHTTGMAHLNFFVDSYRYVLNAEEVLESSTSIQIMV